MKAIRDLMAKKGDSSRKHAKTPSKTTTSITTAIVTSSRGDDGLLLDWRHSDDNDNNDGVDKKYVDKENVVGVSPKERRRRKSQGVSPKSFYHVSPSSNQPTTTTATTTKSRKSDATSSSPTKPLSVIQDIHTNYLRHERRKVTRRLKTQREVFRSMTSLRMFPRQDVAFEEYRRLMNEHLGITEVAAAAATAALESHERHTPNNDDSNNPSDIMAEYDYGDASSSSSATSSSYSTSSIEHDVKRRTLWSQLATTESPTKLRRQWQDDLIRERAISKQVIDDDDDDDYVSAISFLPALWSLEPRIFCQETSQRGQRNYMVGHMGRCMDEIWRKAADRLQRHYYELIPEQTPCRLYLDLEFTKASNPHITGNMIERLMDELLEELVAEFHRIYPQTTKVLDRRCIVDLESSTSTKFSRHIIVHIPWQEDRATAENVRADATCTSATPSTKTTVALFQDAAAVGRFVKVWIGRLAEELATGILETKRPVLAQCLFVNPPPPSSNSKSSSSSQQPQLGTKTQAKDNAETSLAPVMNTVADSYQPHRLLSLTTSETDTDELMSTNHETRHDLDDNCLDLSPNEPSQKEASADQPTCRPTCFVDLGVYSRNRLFRLMGSWKFGKQASAALRIADTNQFLFEHEFGNDKFYLPAKPETITSNDQEAPSQLDFEAEMKQFWNAMDWTPHAEALAQTLIVPMNASKLYHYILPDSDLAKALIGQSNNILHVRRLISHGGTNDEPVLQPLGGKLIMEKRGTSPFPLLDEFCLSVLGTRGGVQGGIRTWSIQYRPITPTSQGGGDDNDNDGGSDDVLVAESITYQMVRNRWCECIGRAHKGNNIMWTIDFRTFQCIQTCHDPECRMMRFSGTPVDLSDDLRAHIRSVLSSSEGKRNGKGDEAYENDNDNDDDDDAEFEKALLALNLNDPAGSDGVEQSRSESPQQRAAPDNGINLSAPSNVDLEDDLLLQAIMSNPDLFP